MGLSSTDMISESITHTGRTVDEGAGGAAVTLSKAVIMELLWHFHQKVRPNIAVIVRKFLDSEYMCLRDYLVSGREVFLAKSSVVH